MIKAKKVDKETRRLMEAVSDLVKKKGDRYKFKKKSKKNVKRIKKSCFHWYMYKGKLTPAVVSMKDRPGYWRCGICGAEFPIQPPKDPQEYKDNIKTVIEYIDQMEFWSVNLGGDSEDTKMFLRLKELLPRFDKVSKQIRKQVNKRDQFERNRQKTDLLQQFDPYTGFNYR